MAATPHGSIQDDSNLLADIREIYSRLPERRTLELGVLALIPSKPRYGYDLVSALERWEPLATTEGTA